MEADKSSNSCRELQDNEEENEVLKRRITSHPLYGLLIEHHKDCLKVGSILISSERGHQETNYKQNDSTKPSTSMHSASELDHFMEAYCSALSKLKEAMEEPQQETLAFINSMHSQLSELTRTNPAPADTSGERG